ncbi:AMP-binding protein [Arthrobacter sp. zg-Y1110]|uniref:AMP-binding protein n=1 Tax=Arthrobacter sp. zg-Y1110 TaxID=2886932 RepID=UPI001D147292|nr:AMP-binding protein [Arthrobacter sp. zg-Y1110]MCC3289832.1 AMP-binding protein [Arthrobacter sp. zg-Y1110]UWX84753.1 AMP-binding protein [Arthrobacter sp. zg-Y1110]
MPNLASILSDTAARSPDSPVLRIGDSVMSYAALDELSARAAGLLAARGIGSGDRVALLLPDVPPMAALYYGILRQGAVAVPMNPLLAAKEIAHQLADSGARLLFAFGYEDILAHADDGAAEAGADVIPVNTGSFRELLAAAAPRPGVVDRADNDAAVILYTSGATGPPKGATLSHANLRSTADAASGLLPVQDSDVLFGGLPLFHGFGQALVMNAAVLTGASVSLLPRFEPGTALQMIERDGVTIFAGIPAMYAAMLEHPALGEADTSSVRWGISGTAPLPRESLEGIEQAFGSQVLEAYGLAEALVSFNAPVPERRSGSVGQPVPGMEVRILDGAANDVPEGEVGELVTRGEGLMLGYWNDPQTTAAALADGWLHTGDLARLDEQGNIYVVGRVET